VLSVHNPCKKQATALENFVFPAVAFSFCFCSFFAFSAKNGIAHFGVGCRRYRSGSSGFTLRQLPLEMPFLFFKRCYLFTIPVFVGSLALDLACAFTDKNRHDRLYRQNRHTISEGAAANVPLRLSAPSLRWARGGQTASVCLQTGNHPVSVIVC